jgi:hypothetical protein
MKGLASEERVARQICLSCRFGQVVARNMASILLRAAHGSEEGV